MVGHRGRRLGQFFSASQSHTEKGPPAKIHVTSPPLRSSITRQLSSNWSFQFQSYRVRAKKKRKYAGSPVWAESRAWADFVAKYRSAFTVRLYLVLS